MIDFSTWRGFNLRPRIAKIEKAFRREPIASADEIPILVNTPCYFSFGSLDKPPDYYTNPTAMYAYQAQGYERHLRLVSDDYVPYFMPWFGVGVLASAFGAAVRMPEDPADDPVIAESWIRSPSDISRLKLPDPEHSGWMPRVLQAIDYAVALNDLPVGLTDMQGPLDTVGQLCGQAQLYQWMYKEPQMVHELFDIVTQAFIEWVKVQKSHIGEPLERSNGLQGAFSPGCGVWESDDDLVLISPELYEEFVLPCVLRIFSVFGSGSVHFCGNGVPQLNNLEKVSNLAVVNNSPLGNYPAFHKLARTLGGKVTIQIQDASPIDVERYYAHLFSELDDFRGLMLATFVLDNTGMDGAGGYLPVAWNPFETANRVVQAVRENAAKRLRGETTHLEDSSPVFTPGKPKTDQAPSQAVEVGHSSMNPAQLVALKSIKESLVDFDVPGLQQAVQTAIDGGLTPFEIIIHGMAEGMNEVGQRYEQGDFFLPELVMAGSAMQAGMQVLQPLLKGVGGTEAISKGTVVLGTVKGDVHDIGKNLVRTMLEGAQYEVIDLGVDVPPGKFVEAVQTHKAEIVGMSALLTTTLRGMQQTVQALEEAGLRSQVKIMIGGAPVSQEYADQIGADGYARTAVGAVHEANRLLGKI
jgi:5-methyltetrahydrofolate--homocysteine methyltransferase